MYENIIELMNELIEEMLKYRLGELKEVQNYALEKRDIAMLEILNIYCKDIGTLCDDFENITHALNSIHYYKKGNIE